MAYEIVIGLETHVELSTNSKLFCSCGGHSEADEPNDCVCPACCGMPGMLPVVNKQAIELAVKAGLMLNCKINQYTTFDKKSYYYPDLPAAYQTTQWFNPICVEGLVDVETAIGTSQIGIKQIHVEEDAGKLVHTNDSSLVDYNRTSVPLIEIVTKPDFRSAEEVISYLKTLKSKLQFAGISECEEGAMRCDINISVRPEGSDVLGVRTEIKNMSSLTSIEEAINKEAIRHIDALERRTEVLVQETRRWDDVKKRTFPMRNKETAADYRYFPDPNVMPVVIDDKWLQEIKDSMPKTIDEQVEKYMALGLSQREAAAIVTDSILTNLLDDMISKDIDVKIAAGWILTDCLGILKKNNIQVKDLVLDVDKLAWIIKTAQSGEITRNTGKTVLSAVILENADPKAYCEQNNLMVKTDLDLIKKVVAKAIEANPKAVEDYKAGKEKALLAIFGFAMRELRGAGSPDLIRQILLESLAE